MRLFRRLFLSFCFSLLAVPAVVACSCAPFDPEQAYKDAKYVFEGYLTQAEVIEGPDGSVGLWDSNHDVFVVGKLDISKIWKGSPKSLDGVITHSQSSACGVGLAPGRKYVFFVYDIWEEKSFLSKSRYGIITACRTPHLRSYEEFNSILNWLEALHVPGT